MAIRPKAELRKLFETGDRPSQQDFIDLIDSFLHASGEDFPSPLPTADLSQAENIPLPDPLPALDGRHLINVAAQEWIALAGTVSKIDSNNLSISGDLSAELLTGRRLRVSLPGEGYYATSIVAAVFNEGQGRTDIEVSPALPSQIGGSAWVGFLTPPEHGGSLSPELVGAAPEDHSHAEFNPGGHAHNMEDTLGLIETINLLAPRTSPAFAGTPTAPTPAASSNSGALATTEFVQRALETNAPLLPQLTASSGSSELFGVIREGIPFIAGNGGSNANGQGNSTASRNTLTTLPLPPGTPLASKLFLGTERGFLITTDGALYAWGNNSNGALGLGDTVNRGLAEKVTFPPAAGNIVSVHTTGPSGSANTCAFALDDLGQLFAWGDNGEGRLGLGDELNRLTPEQIPGTWLAVAPAANGTQASTLAIKSDNTLWGWGANARGELGLGDSTQRNSPTYLGLSSIVKAICPGGFSGSSLSWSYVLDSNGDAWLSGYNGYGQLGNGSSANATSWQKLDALDAEVITDIFAGGHFYGVAGAILDDGSVRLWGYNGYGQLGTGDNVKRTSPFNPGLSGVQQGMVCGESAGSSVLLRNDEGRVFSSGYNAHSVLGDGTSSNRNVFAEVPALTRPGVSVVDLRAFGRGGLAHAAALLSDGTVHTWGRNGLGELARGHTTAGYAPAKVAPF